ncbi:DUF4190 domain-containing protein [Microbacterium sp. HA-8]|uniref:DUF4190 domain-containing protein n=1 Tax=Microbacterium sp. HA-8 TaxID=3234200 RepID=UPI0038F7C40C
MSDTTPPPPGSTPPNQNPAGYPAPNQPPAYGAAPPPAYATSSPAPGAPVPGKTLGIVAFILSFFVQLVALILGIIALVQSRKAGAKNGWALAAIIISVILMIIGIIVGIALIGLAIGAAEEYARLCSEYGPGTHEVSSGVTITCN